MTWKSSYEGEVNKEETTEMEQAVMVIRVLEVIIGSTGTAGTVREIFHLPVKGIVRSGNREYLVELSISQREKRKKRIKFSCDRLLEQIFLFIGC